MGQFINLKILNDGRSYDRIHVLIVLIVLIVRTIVGYAIVLKYSHDCAGHLLPAAAVGFYII